MVRTKRARYPWLRLLLALLLSSLFGPTPAPVSAATCSVTNPADSGAGTLRARLSDINCDEIAFDLVAMGTDTIALASTLPVIGRPLSLTGPGPEFLTLRGNNTFPLIIVNIAGGNVAIGGMTLTGGHAAAGYGGNLRSSGGNLTLTDLALTGGTAAANQGGAGAYLSNGTTTLTRVVVSGNSAPGGPTYGSGAGLFIDEFFGPSIVTIADSRIVGNIATNNSGGGIAVWRTERLAGRTLDVRLVNTVIGTAASPNNATFGAGIYCWYGTLTLTDSTVEGNQAADAGGGIYSFGSTTTVTGSTVVGNRAAAGLGGGLYHEYGPVTVTNSTFSGNQTTGGSGGGIYHYGNTLKLTNATVVGNTGGIATRGGPGEQGVNRLWASVVIGNGAQDCVATLVASSTSQGYNVVGSGTGCPSNGTDDVAVTGALATVVDPTLADNGGPTRTHALAPDSPALDRVPAGECDVVTDQRGIARPQGAGCDSGAFEEVVAAPSPSPSPSPSPDPSPSAGTQATLTVTTAGSGVVGRNPAGANSNPYSYPTGQAVTLTPQPGAGQTFVGWTVDGVNKGWSPSLTITLTANHNVQAAFAPTASFPDVDTGRPDALAIIELASRGTIRGYGTGSYGPDDGVQRAQMAALIARATSAGPDAPPLALIPPACLAGGTWDCENWGNGFSDRQGLDANLWRNVGTLQHYRVAFGYDGAACAARGVASPCYGPTEAVSYAQTITFITRMMQVKGYWQPQPGAPLPYGGVPGPHMADVATFAHYTGGVPAPPGDWSAGATRGWFARALWAALNSYWGSDTPGSGGYVP